VLSKHKPDSRTQFIDASALFKKETNNNILTEEHIARIMDVFDSKEDVPHFAAFIDHATVSEKDYNLSVSTYVEPKDTREVVDIAELNAELAITVIKINRLRADIDAILTEIEGDEGGTSKQSYMEKMLGGVAVEWTDLGDDDFFEIANAARRPIKASLRTSGRTPYYGANNIQDYVDGHTHDGEFVLIAEDGSASLENYSIQYAKGRFWANNHVHVVRGTGQVDTKFLCHYLKTVNFLPFLSGGGRAKLTKGKLIEIHIPIPPLSVQKEVVRILDTFTDLNTELNTELNLRNKQYIHYRDMLLRFQNPENGL